MIMGQRSNPTGMSAAQQRQALSGGPAPISVGKPAVINSQPNFFERIGSGAMDYLSDPNNRARLAAGFNTMRLNPDPNIAKMVQSQLETEQAMDLLKAQGNKTAEWLEANGYKEEAALVRQNPAIAKDVISKVMTQRGKGGLTDAFRTKALQAEAAGLVPGTPEYRKFMGAETQYSGLSEEQLSGVSSIRKEFMGIPEVKAFQSQASAFGRISASAEDPSPAGDLALIFNYMKLLDPGSTVREGEFATAQNAGGVGERIVSLYNNILQGTRLTESQRADFLGRADKLYTDAERQYAGYESEYKRLMSPWLPEGASADAYFPSFRYIGSKPEAPASSAEAYTGVPTKAAGNLVGKFAKPGETIEEYRDRLLAEAKKRGIKL